VRGQETTREERRKGGEGLQVNSKQKSKFKEGFDGGSTIYFLKAEGSSLSGYFFKARGPD